MNSPTAFHTDSEVLAVREHYYRSRTEKSDILSKALEEESANKPQESQQAPPYDVKISEQGLEKLSSLQRESAEDQRLKAVASNLDYVDKSNYSSKFGNLPSTQSIYIEQMSSELLDNYAKAYDEIAKGYEDGTREVYVKDDKAKYGIRRATMEDEVALLNEAFSDRADYIEERRKDAPKWIEMREKMLASMIESKKIFRKQNENAVSASESKDSLASLEKIKVQNEKLPQNVNASLISAVKQFVVEFHAKGGKDIDIKEILNNALFPKKTA